jgi:ComEC/Rec2-related protein
MRGCFYFKPGLPPILRPERLRLIEVSLVRSIIKRSFQNGFAFLCWAARQIHCFWQRYPALFVGFCFFLGTSIALGLSFFTRGDLVLLPLLFCLFPYRRLAWGALLIGVAFVATLFRVTIPHDAKTCGGVLRAEVVDRHIVTIHGNALWKMMLKVQSFRSFSGDTLLKGVTVPVYLHSPCQMYGGNLYQVNAWIHVDDHLSVRLRPCIGKRVVANERTFSCVEWRLRIKRTLEKMFIHLFPDVQIRQVAGGLTFGLFKDPLLQQAMHRAGVEHVLAVSGFHFGIVAALTVFLTQAMAPKGRAILAMCCLTLYLLIIGPLPSVVRAWCSAIVILGGVCLQRRSSGINCLGVGLIALVFYDPASVTNVGFQLSFLATAAILFFSKRVLTYLRLLFPKRCVQDVARFSICDQCALLAIEWFLPALSLLIPVFIVLCPYQLAFLQDFSVLGLMYNMAIPALFSLAMPGVLLAILLYPIPFLPHLLSCLAEIPLSLGLVLVDHAPESAWSMVSGGILPHAAGRGLIVLIFLVGIIVHGYEDSEREEAWKACL